MHVFMCVCMCVSANLCFDWISSAALVVTLWWHKLWKLIWLNRDVEQLHEQQCRQGIRWIPIVMLIPVIILTCDCPPLSDLWSTGCWSGWRCWLHGVPGSGSTGQSGGGLLSINLVHCTHCGIVHYTVWTIQRNLNLVFKSQHGKKWMIFFVNTNSTAANQNLYKWLLTPSGAASCDNKQFGFLGDQNALCGNPRRTLNANPSYRQIHLMSSRQNIYQQSTQTGCNIPCVCCSGYVRNAHACYCVHCDHCCGWKASPVSGLVTLWESDHVTCVPLRFFSTTACCDHNHVLLFKPVSKTLITGSSK